MKIENEAFQFHPQCQFAQLQLDPLQKQYLAHMRMGHSIQDLVIHYQRQGWLIDFQKLYDMVVAFAENHWLLNPNILEYFKNLKLQPKSTIKTVPGIKNEKAQYDQKKLQQLPFFRSLNTQLATFLLNNSEVLSYPAESLICQTGELSRDMYVILSGQAAIYKQNGPHRQFLALLSESSVFGEAGFLLGEKRGADIITTKKSDILVVPYQPDFLDRFLNKEKAIELQKRFWIQHALLHSELFKSFPSDCLDALTFSGEVVNLQEGQMLFKEGDTGTSAFIVIQGNLELQKSGKSLGNLTQGAFFGEMSLMLTGGKRTATVRSQRGSMLMEIKKDNFYSLLSQNLYLAKEIQLLARKRIESNTALVN